MKLEWSAAALADLDRFAVFLRDRHPAVAGRIGAEIIAKARIIETHPLLERPV
ncbi:type II toxin-antitoxin system RelE/ParE family toxin [Xanthobacteraceae bacterium Astr-EGSB]|uniref:type II toxin-antitoxin system RelE/ParE family toxin n=1 Tax=Astrobacterium formosum TaxID=3069710 RepID=UPI0027AE0E15|nr:type II toxin-antitoxin system RelE/ParE family toxin [Xanthobacteraceae bacterium Astr-EGSB]